MGIKKRTSLTRAFWKFLIWLLAGLGMAVVVPFGILLIAVNLGVVTFADYSERQTQAIIPTLTATPNVADVLLPVGTKYMRLDREYGLIETDMDESEQTYALNFARTGQVEAGGKTQFALVDREDEYIILQYYIGSQYINTWMEEHFPSPEAVLLGVIFLNCLLVCVLLTTHFAKMLQKELLPLFEATKEIEQQNLDFEMKHSKIIEFENVLHSFDSMRSSLRNSLEQQWRSEQIQKEQIASLAHDLKTPLTVMQGNLDLLTETELDEKQQMYTEYAVKSSEQMKEYIRMLIDITKAMMGYQLQKEEINFKNFWQNILFQAEIICKGRRITLISKQNGTDRTIVADVMLLERAVMNLITNASEYAPADTPLYVEAFVENATLCMCVMDCGCGFTKEALKHAQERFYMSDQSRGLQHHFGMGLYIADSIIKQHGGKLILENSKETKGAKVTIVVPLENEG